MSSNDHDETCVKMFTTLCVSVTNVERVKKTHTHKEKPSKLLEQTHKHETSIKMPKDNWWSIKQKGCEDSTRAHGMSSRICNHQWENQGRL